MLCRRLRILGASCLRAIEAATRHTVMKMRARLCSTWFAREIRHGSGLYTDHSSGDEGCSGVPLQVTGWSGRHPRGRRETRGWDWVGSIVDDQGGGSALLSGTSCPAHQAYATQKGADATLRRPFPARRISRHLAATSKCAAERSVSRAS